MSLNRRVVPLLVLGVLQLGDLFSTRMAMKVPGVLELNPIVRRLGLWDAKLLAVALIVLLAWRAKKMGPLWTACGVYACVVVSNVLLVFTHLRKF